MHLKISKFVSLHQKYLKQKVKDHIYKWVDWTKKKILQSVHGGLQYNAAKLFISINGYNTYKLLAAKIYLAPMTVIGNKLAEHIEYGKWTTDWTNQESSCDYRQRQKIIPSSNVSRLAMEPI